MSEEAAKAGGVAGLAGAGPSAAGASAAGAVAASAAPVNGGVDALQPPPGVAIAATNGCHDVKQDPDTPTLAAAHMLQQMPFGTGSDGDE